jgi:hypothetical protein
MHVDEAHGLCKRPSRAIIASKQVEFICIGLEATQQADKSGLRMRVKERSLVIHAIDYSFCSDQRIIHYNDN